MTSNVYTINEVACHDNIDDLWTVMNGKVYDLTKFAKEHPGGQEVLEEVAGKDGTSCFDNIGHSTEAIIRREIYLIGELGKDEQSNENKNELKKKATGLNNMVSSSSVCKPLVRL